jgi:hypothetical protein
MCTKLKLRARILSNAEVIFPLQMEKLPASPGIPHKLSLCYIFPIHLERRQVEWVTAVLDTEDAKQEAVHAEQDTGP